MLPGYKTIWWYVCCWLQENRTLKIRGITLAETRAGSLVIQLQRVEGDPSVAVSSPRPPRICLPASSDLELPWKLLEPQSGVTVFSSHWRISLIWGLLEAQCFQQPPTHTAAAFHSLLTHGAKNQFILFSTDFLKINSFGALWLLYQDRHGLLSHPRPFL